MRAAVLLLLVPLLASCKTTRAAGECPDNLAARCLTEKVCTEDRARGCQVCVCAPPRGANLDDPRSGDAFPRDPARP